MTSASGAALTPVVLLISLSLSIQSRPTDERARALEYVGNDACIACHRQIYDGYSATAMARTSGAAGANLDERLVRPRPARRSLYRPPEGPAAILYFGQPASR